MTYPGSYEPLAPASKKRTGLVVGLVAAVLVVVLGTGFVVWFTVFRTSAERGAVGACEDAIRVQLKAPATAKFSNVRATSSPLGGFDVSGSVDAENSFGALVRNDWTCYAAASNGKWSTRASLD